MVTFKDYKYRHKGASCRKKNNMRTSKGSLGLEKTCLKGGINEFKKKQLFKL